MDQFEDGSGVPRPISKKEVQHIKLFTIRKEKNTHRFSTDGLEMINTGESELSVGWTEERVKAWDMLGSSISSF